MLLLELGQVVDILVDNDPEVVGLVVRGHIGGRVSARHDAQMAILDSGQQQGDVGAEVA